MLSVTLPRRTWPGSNPEARAEEMQYIVEETRTLFRANMAVSSVAAVRACVEECEQRKELALHYRIARPRLFNVNGITGQQMRETGAAAAYAPPTYMHSYYQRTPQTPSPSRAAAPPLTTPTGDKE